MNYQNLIKLGLIIVAIAPQLQASDNQPRRRLAAFVALTDKVEIEDSKSTAVSPTSVATASPQSTVYDFDTLTRWLDGAKKCANRGNLTDDSIRKLIKCLNCNQQTLAGRPNQDLITVYCKVQKVIDGIKNKYNKDVSEEEFKRLKSCTQRLRTSYARKNSHTTD